jgi:succinate dehydrogenase / fumarate reductase cytochrome b subunit
MAAVDRPVAKSRPVYLNLFEIRQPLPAIVSILHRASGALLFVVGVPFVLWALQGSLASAEGFARFQAAIGHPAAKIILLVLAWGYLHHLLAGVRHLLLDARVGLDLPSARRTAAGVLVLSLFLTLLVGIRLW